MGSSSVRMCCDRCLLMWFSMAASVVLLPAPVTPVTRTIPRFVREMSASCRRQLKLLDGGDLERDHAHHDAHGAALAEDVHPEPSDPLAPHEQS
jgi:hypothetical protein